MQRRHGLFLTLMATGLYVVSAQGCGGSPVNNMPVVCAPGDKACSPRWGEETPNGPRDEGKDLGKMMVNGVMGEVYDSNGDGMPDEIDIDGDGISDGEDIDGDGVITIWAQLSRGDDAANPAATFPDTPLDIEDTIAPKSPLPGESAEGPAMSAMTVGLEIAPGDAVPVGKPAGNSQLRGRSQGNTNACGAFAAAAVATYVRYEKEKASNPTVDINTLWASPLYFYQQNGDSNPNEKMCYGSNAPSNLNTLFYGVPSEAEVPFISPANHSTDTDPCTRQVPDDKWQNSAVREGYRIAGYAKIRETGADFRTRVKAELAMGRPILFGTKAPNDLEQQRVTKTGADGKPNDELVAYKGTTPGRGGHAMVITALDEKMRAYRILNSWGGDWGDNGHVWWDFDAFETMVADASTWQFSAYVVYPLPADAPPIPAFDPTKVTVTDVTENRRVAFEKVEYWDRSATDYAWYVYARVKWSEGIILHDIATNLGGPVPAMDPGDPKVYLNENQWEIGMYEGEIRFQIPGTQVTSMDGKATDLGAKVGMSLGVQITVKGRDKKTDIVRTLPLITIPAPK